ncbi:MAG: electron transfer flavoprotein subunit alpha/FixB family protein [Lachnospiraceae bacterium]
MRGTDVSKWSGILVYLECYEGSIHKAGFELIGEAVRLQVQSGDELYVLAIGKNMNAVKKVLEGYPIRRAYLYETEDEYTPSLYEQIAVSCIEELKPSIVLIGGTNEGRALAPRLSVAFETGLTADCTELGIDEDGGLIQTRPAFGGNVMASIVTPQCRPQFATVRPGVMKTILPEDFRGTEFEMRISCKKENDTKVLSIVEAKVQDDITEQDILVVAGRGVRKKEDLSMLRELAELLGGKLASSRALVEKGWMSPREQIGLSGHTVAPKYLIACGVSGTVQFMAGMKNAKNIIAINTDPNARIFEIAHYPICGDLYEIVPELISMLKQRKEDECAKA